MLSKPEAGLVPHGTDALAGLLRCSCGGAMHSPGRRPSGGSTRHAEAEQGGLRQPKGVPIVPLTDAVLADVDEQLLKHPEAPPTSGGEDPAGAGDADPSRGSPAPGSGPSRRSSRYRVNWTASSRSSLAGTASRPSARRSPSGSPGSRAPRCLSEVAPVVVSFDR